ncbi:hypothetical protein MHK_006755 [Candidatus Magnetomorum sp. HK-1]|nr:hypothetical protein MHK_006755 [Candidatus Magnetomorum sp. HK-1]
MLNFDLSDTKAGEELIDMGLQKGLKKGRQELLYTQLYNRFVNFLILKILIQTINFSNLTDSPSCWTRAKCTCFKLIY